MTMDHQDPRIPILDILYRQEYDTTGNLAIDIQKLEEIIADEISKINEIHPLKAYTVKELLNSLINDGIIFENQNCMYLVTKRKIKLFKMLIS